MYNPQRYKTEDSTEAFDLMDQNPFATIISIAVSPEFWPVTATLMNGLNAFDIRIDHARIESHMHLSWRPNQMASD